MPDTTPKGALTLERMRADIAAMVDEAPEELKDDDNLLDWGLDSLRIVNLTVEWSQYGVELGFAHLAEAPTLADWWRIVESQSGESRS